MTRALKVGDRLINGPGTEAEVIAILDNGRPVIAIGGDQTDRWAHDIPPNYPGWEIIPEKREPDGWINVYPTFCVSHISRKMADWGAMHSLEKKRIACVPYYKGEGLEEEKGCGCQHCKTSDCSDCTCDSC